MWPGNEDSKWHMMLTRQEALTTIVSYSVGQCVTTLKASTEETKLNYERCEGEKQA